MDINQIIDALEREFANSKNFLFTKKTLVNMDKCASLIAEIRANLPQAIQEASYVLSKKEQILNNAQAEAKHIVAEAEYRAEQLVSSSEIKKKSERIAEENIQRKLEETKRQAVSVLNADDYDLMYEYASNKPKLCYYQVSERMQNVLNDMFYYCGYSVEQQMTPDINSRHLFNFVQADLKIVETSNLTSDIESDIIEKFKQGVTFMHKVSWYGDYVWDLDQTHENWEESLLS